MYGAFIGDIVGSKYEFNNIKTKDFPLFSQGCDYTDDTIMTVAVAKAIILSRREQEETAQRGRGFQEFLVETMQDFGRRYPHPMGAYGGKFANWLRQKDPKPYGSFGNGSAMRVSPCGLAATSIEEALVLARVCASVTHDHPEGIKGAEAVAAAIFMAKCGESKEAIRQYISEHYYNLDFTLDAIRDSYCFNETCQGSVPQAIVAFLESESFEDAIRNIISIGGDSDTTGAITGSIAWVYYIGYQNWLNDRLGEPMQKLKEQTMAYLPEEFIEIEKEFLEAGGIRWSMRKWYGWNGQYPPLLNLKEIEKYVVNWGKQDISPDASYSPITQELKEELTQFCLKYIVLAEILYRDLELNSWCRSFIPYVRSMKHKAIGNSLGHIIQEPVMGNFSQQVLSWRPYSDYQFETALAGTEEDLIHGIFAEVWADAVSWRYRSIADGNLYLLMNTYLSFTPPPAPEPQPQEPTFIHPHYTLEYIAQKCHPEEKAPGACSVWHDQSEQKWRLTIQLDENWLWFLSVYIRDNGTFECFWLDYEAADDSHYQFLDEQAIRKDLYAEGDENRYFHEILIRFVKEHGGSWLLSKIEPYITNQYHFY